MEKRASWKEERCKVREAGPDVLVLTCLTCGLSERAKGPETADNNPHRPHMTKRQAPPLP